MDKQNLIKILKDIRFWIFLFFVIRLFGITDAPLEMGHNWRQALTNMIARNFLEISPNIFYPRIDMAGSDSGILGSEFPFFSYLIFLAAKVFGYEHWYGRLINLVVSSIGIYYFYLLVKKYFNVRIAFNSAIILIVSIWFSFSRKIMPDVFSVSIVIIGIYYAMRFFETGRLFNLVLFFLFNSLGILCKIPALALMSSLAIPLLSNYDMKRKTAILISGFVSILIVSLWYFYWVPYLVETFHFKLYFPKGILQGLIEITENPLDTLDKFWFTSFYSFVAFAFFLAGLVLMIVKKNRLLTAVFALISVVFFIFMLKTGDVFSFHNYYIIPYTPLMALVAGFALSYIQTKWQYIVLILITIESLANQSYDFFIKDKELYKLELESSIENIIDQNALIIVNGTQSPQTIYFIHRKGWTLSNEEILAPDAIDSMKNKGAEYLIIDKHRLENTFQYPVVFSNAHIEVYSLK